MCPLKILTPMKIYILGGLLDFRMVLLGFQVKEVSSFILGKGYRNPFVDWCMMITQSSVDSMFQTFRRQTFKHKFCCGVLYELSGQLRNSAYALETILFIRIQLESGNLISQMREPNSGLSSLREMLGPLWSPTKNNRNREILLDESLLIFPVYNFQFHFRLQRLEA